MRSLNPGAYTSAPGNPPSDYEANNDVLVGPSEVYSVDRTENSFKMNYANNPAFSTAHSGQSRPNAVVTDCDTNQSLQNRLETWKTWSVNTLKCTKQIIEEKLGTANVTCDKDLEGRISSLKCIQLQYRTLRDLAHQLTNSLEETLKYQKDFASHMTILSQKQPELRDEFTFNAETQRIVVTNGEKLLAVMFNFVDSLNTLIDRTFADTLKTISAMESARIEYDAYRKEIDSMNDQHTINKPNENTIQPNTSQQIQHKFQSTRNRYIELKSSVDIKLKLLHDNRLRVMKNQLTLFHNASSAFFSGNNHQLEQILNQFNLKQTNFLK